MDLITTNPGMRVEAERLNRQFRSLCKTPKAGLDHADDESQRFNQPMDENRPFGFMYNLFQWAVILGARDGRPAELSGQTDVPFRWGQIPDAVRHRLLSIALLHLLRNTDSTKEKDEAERLLSMDSDELSELLRTTMEQLANRGLQLIDVEVTTESPDAYLTIENLIDTIQKYTEYYK